MYLYLDLIWLLNFCLDFLLLWLTAVFRKLEFRWWRLAGASFLGSSYVLFLFIPPLQSFYTFVIKLLLSAVLIMVAFGFGQIQRFMSTFCTFYFVSFVTGGGILGLHFFLQSQHELMQGMMVTQFSGYGDPLSWLFVLFGFAFMLWFSRNRWKQIEKTKRTEHFLVDVNIYFGPTAISCRGLVDTGNQLTDPISKMPVMMLEGSLLREVVPSELLEHIVHLEIEMGAGMEKLQDFPQWVKRLRIIPYRGVQQGMKLMYAIKPDYVEIVQEDCTYGSDRSLIGINNQPLSREGTFQAVVHPDLLQTELKKEAVVSC